MSGPSDEPAARAEVLAVVSHDIRAPLGVILGAVTELMDPRMGPLTEAQRSLLQLVRRSSERLVRLAANVQVLSRLEAGGLTLARQALDARDLARRAVESFERSGESAKQSVALQVGGERADLHADPELAVHAIVNVLANAVRFARREVVVSVASDGEQTSIVVDDDGPGFAPEALARLRGEVAPPSSGGKRVPPGLGLPLAMKIVRDHGGAISAETRTAEAGEPLGTRVRIVFPRTQPG